MSINWNMAIGPNIGSHVMNSFQDGQERGRQVAGRNALAAYAMNPNEQTLGGVAQYDHKFVLEQRQAQAQKAQADLAKVARLLDGIADEQTYQQRLSMARNAGIDTSQAPANYDPKWVGDMTSVYKLLTEKPEAASTIGKEAIDAGFRPGTPEFQEFVMGRLRAEAVKTIPYAPGGGVATYNPLTDKTNVIVQPNYGQGVPGAPAGGVQRKTVNGKVYEQRQGKWYEVGGAASNGGGNFPGQ